MGERTAGDSSGLSPLIAEYCIRLGDDRLVLGHRLSEWCGHAPVLEEELALGNVALDLIGGGATLLGLAGELERRGRTADGLAYFREALEYRNCLLVEQPNGDFATTIVRQFFFDAFDVDLTSGLRSSTNAAIARWAESAAKESEYHFRHSQAWVLRLGDGTEESHRRTVAAVESLYWFCGELFERDSLVDRLVVEGVAADPGPIRGRWRDRVESTLREAGIPVFGESENWATGGRRGLHSEHLGRMLAEMQIVARSHPGATW